MAKKGQIKATIAIGGATEYRKAIKDIAIAEKELQSEMKKTQAQFKEDATSEAALAKKKEVLTKQIELQTRKLEEQRKMVASAAEAQTKYANNTSKLEKILEDVKNGTGELNEEQKKVCKEMGFQVETVEDLEKALAASNKQYDAAGIALKQYQTKANDAETGLINLNHELASVDKNLEGVTEEADDGAKGIQEVGDSAEKSSEGLLKMGDIIKANVISGAVLSGIKQLAQGIADISKAAISTGAEFEASMSQVAATMGMSTDEIRSGSEAYKTLEEAARQCGETTMYSATEAGQALNYLALAGYDAAKAAETLPKVLDLAAAGGMDLATASDLVTDAMAALGMETSELDTYIDEMAKTAQKSNTSVQQLGEATLVTAGIAKTTGVSLEDLNTALGVLANNGIKGAEGGTHLRNVLISLSAPTDTAAAKLKELGIETEDDAGNMRDLESILIDLNGALSDMGSAEKAQAIRTIFNKTDIAAVNALLKSTTGEYSGLRSEIEKSAGAASTMAKTMNDNLKGQVTILKSNLEALGISASKVFDEDLKNGVTEASRAVQRLNESVSSGSMHTSLSKLSSAMGEFISKLANAADDVLPKVIDDAAWCIDNFDLIASGIAGIAAANVTMGTVVPMITAVNGAWKAYKTTTEGATVAQFLLNTAMKDNPAGLLITAITAIVAAIGTYVAINKAAVEETAKLSDEEQEIANSLKSVKETTEQAATARANDRAAMETQKNMVKQLKDELTGYVDANGKVLESNDRVKTIVGQLNELVPGLALYYDEASESISMTTEELEKNTEALWKQAEAQAIQEQMTDIMKRRIEVQTELTKQEGAYSDAIAKVSEESKKLADLKSGADAAWEEDDIETYGRLKQAYDEQKQTVLDLQKAYMDIVDPYHALQGELNELDEEERILTESLGASKDALEESGDAADGYADALSGAAGEIEDTWSKMHDDVVSSIQGQINIFDEYKKATAHTKDEVLKNMREQVQGIEDWSKNIQELSKKGISEGLLQELAKMGPEGAGYVAAFKNMSADELAEASKLFEDSLVLPETTLTAVENSYKEAGQVAYEGYIEEIEKNKTEAQHELFEHFKEVTQSVPEGAAEGIKDKTDVAEDAVEDMADSTEKALKEKLQIHSPSVVFEKLGYAIPEGLAKGVTSKKDEVDKAIKDIADNVTKTMETAMHPDIFQKLGAAVGDGLIKGILAKIPEVTKAAQDMAKAAETGTKEQLKIQSPSKVFEELGEFTGQGFMGGFEESMMDFTNVLNSMMPTAEDLQTSSVTQTSNVTNNFQIYGAEGQDVTEIAQAVQDILNDQWDSERVVFA